MSGGWSQTGARHEPGTGQQQAGKTALASIYIQLKTSIMARTRSNNILEGLHGLLGNVVIKSYGDRTVISSVPDMSRVKPSALQKKSNRKFADAVKYAQAINRDPARKKAYSKKVKKGQSVFQYAISEYLNKNK
jgi:hypothetical protein